MKPSSSVTKILMVARKTLVEMWRETQLMAFDFLLPLSFVVIFALGYSANPRLATYQILVFDQGGQSSQELLARIAQTTYDDGRPIFKLESVDDLQSAEEILKNHQAAALLILKTTGQGQPSMILRGDAAYMAFNNASNLLSNTLQPYLASLAGASLPIWFVETPLAVRGPVSDFDAFAPGMIIFAILMLLPHTAMILGRELRLGTLRRLQISALSTAELLTGVTLAQMLVALAQVILVLFCAILAGFHNQGSLLLAILIGWLLSFSAIAMGLLVACFSTNDSDALNIGSTVAMLQVFLSGAFFAMPSPQLFIIGSTSFRLFDFIPASHIMIVFQQVLSSGAGLERIAERLIIAAALSAAIFVIAVLLFNRTQRRLR